jgi:starch synthase
MIARLVPQKGYDLLFEIAEAILQLDVGLVVLAAGDKAYQEQLYDLVRENSDRVAARIGFDEPLAHRMMAGADMLLVPSRYEPCGLTQIYGLRYGAVPVVRATGGLDDTISQFNKATGTGNGFKFGPFEPQAFLEQITLAVHTYQDETAWQAIIKNGMDADFSWEESAQQYLALYEKSVDKHRKRTK